MTRWCGSGLIAYLINRLPDSPLTAMPLASDTNQFNLDKLQELKALGDLPSPKGAALAVMRLMRKDDVSVPELARTVQTDPALVARLIKAANAANRGAHRPVAAVQDALIQLGIATVRNLALSFSLLSGHRSGRCTNFDYRRFWSRSLAFAVASQEISAQVHSASPEEAFSVGLLGGIGELALATVYPEAYSKLLEQHKAAATESLSSLEHKAFAITHPELTAAMLHDWGLPRMFVDTVLVHETPESANFPSDSRLYLLTWTLALARQIADICLAAEGDRRGLMSKLLLMGSRLSLEGEGLTVLCDRVVHDWREWASQLNIDALIVPPFGELSEPVAAPELSPAGMPSAPDNLRVLVVDADSSMRTQLRSILAHAGYTVFEAANGQQGFEMALDVLPHILITDWMMAGMDGVELTRALRQTKPCRSTYILILTALDAEEKLVEAFDAGVDDFMSKPLKARVLGARLRSAQRVLTLQREIKRDHEEIRRFAAELAVANRRLQEAALTDVLTGFPNRRYAIERFQEEWQASTRNLRPLTCMMIDFDNFKTINDAHGHAIGDSVLKQATLTIKRALRAHDVLCRTGGDEFMVICPETDLTAGLLCGERIRKLVAEARMDVGMPLINCSISIGVATRGPDTPDIDALIKCADEGAYRAKGLGRNCVATVQQ